MSFVPSVNVKWCWVTGVLGSGAKVVVGVSEYTGLTKLVVPVSVVDTICETDVSVVTTVRMVLTIGVPGNRIVK